jgi:hypothetical protein
MKKIILINLTLLVFASSVRAMDYYDANTKILRIPSVKMGGLNYNNVSVRLSNFKAVLLNSASSPAPCINLSAATADGGGINSNLSDSGMDINLCNTSRGIPSLGDGRVSFSIKVTNKSLAPIYIAAATTPDLSTLSDNEGNVCDNYKEFFNNNPASVFAEVGAYLNISGITGVGSQEISRPYPNSKENIYNYMTIEAGETKIIGVSTFNPAPVDSSLCYFTGDIFTFQSNLWLYNKDTNAPKLISYAFNDIIIPVPKPPKASPKPTTPTSIPTPTPTPSPWR